MSRCSVAGLDGDARVLGEFAIPVFMYARIYVRCTSQYYNNWHFLIWNFVHHNNSVHSMMMLLADLCLLVLGQKKNNQGGSKLSLIFSLIWTVQCVSFFKSLSLLCLAWSNCFKFTLSSIKEFLVLLYPFLQPLDSFPIIVIVFKISINTIRYHWSQQLPDNWDARYESIVHWCCALALFFALKLWCQLSSV